MPAPTSNGNGHSSSRRKAVTASEGGKVSFSSLLAEAQSLKEALRDGYRRASRLSGALRRHRRQSKLVQSTIASLKQLQQIES